MARTICYSCKQVIPATPEEKRLSEEKRKKLEKEQSEAWEAWRNFYTPSDESLWTTTRDILLALLIIFLALSSGVGVMHLGGADEIENMYRGWATTALVGVPLAYFMLIKPARRREREEAARKKQDKENFISQHKQFADVLGFTD